MSLNGWNMQMECHVSRWMELQMDCHVSRWMECADGVSYL